MRKIPALVTVLGLTALSLAGCVSAGAAGCSRPAEAGKGLQSQVQATGELDAEPKVVLDTPLHVEKAATWQTLEGSGTPIVSDDQLVVVDVAVYDGTTGEKLIATPFNGDLSRVFSVSQWAQTFPDFGSLMACASAGSRVLLALPPGGVAEQTAAALGLGEKDSTVAVVDVRKVYLTRATGSAVFNDAHNMPTVVRAPSGQPGIIVPEADPPEDIVVQTLIHGDGEALADDDTARVAYTGVPWQKSAEVFDTTWGDTAASVPVGAAQLPGFAEALKGQTIGSQVLVVVPADKVPFGSGANVPSDVALVYVIDILGVDAATPAATG